MKSHALVFSVFFLFFAKISYSQIPREFVIKVNQFGQFVKRFNYEEDFWGKPISHSFSSKIKRSEYISLLFNKYDNRLDSFSVGYSREYVNLKKQFIEEVITKNYKIKRTSDSLFSIAICDVNYRHVPKTIFLVLKQAKINKGIAWVINDVNADFFYTHDNHSDSFSFIPPTSNEVNYIHLRELFNNKDSLASYAYPGYSCNRLSIFFHLLYCNDLEYKHVKSIVYFITDIPGWIIRVSEFQRDGENSGWLIENIERTNKPVINFIKTAASAAYSK